MGFTRDTITSAQRAPLGHTLAQRAAVVAGGTNTVLTVVFPRGLQTGDPDVHSGLSAGYLRSIDLHLPGPFRGSGCTLSIGGNLKLNGRATYDYVASTYELQMHTSRRVGNAGESYHHVMNSTNVLEVVHAHQYQAAGRENR
jgi:hypothetical protein